MHHALISSGISNGFDGHDTLVTHLFDKQLGSFNFIAGSHPLLRGTKLPGQYHTTEQLAHQTDTDTALAAVCFVWHIQQQWRFHECEY